VRNHQLIKSLIYAFTLAGIILLYYYDKGDLVLFVNGTNSYFLDQMFSLITVLGDGIMFVPATLLLLFIRFKYAIASAVIGLLNLIIVGILKRSIFNDMPRPRNFFDSETTLHFVPWVDVHGYMSFPSGHTTSIFAIALFTALIINRKHITLLLFGIAILVGCSRMYLLQHFYIDVFAGMVLGFLCSYTVWYFMGRFTLPPWSNSRLVIRITGSKSRDVSQAGA